MGACKKFCWVGWKPKPPIEKKKHKESKIAKRPSHEENNPHIKRNKKLKGPHIEKETPWRKKVAKKLSMGRKK